MLVQVKHLYHFILALSEVLRDDTKYDKVVLVRSLIPTREIGFLPMMKKIIQFCTLSSSLSEHGKVYVQTSNEQAFSMLYDRLKQQGSFYFLSTSFLRGLTFDNSIIIVDECQNLNFHELDTIVTRVGQDSKIMFCGRLLCRLIYQRQ